jgi:hypothetical protein
LLRIIFKTTSRWTYDYFQVESSSSLHVCFVIWKYVSWVIYYTPRSSPSDICIGWQQDVAKYGHVWNLLVWTTRVIHVSSFVIHISNVSYITLQQSILRPQFEDVGDKLTNIELISTIIFFSFMKVLSNKYYRVPHKS